MAANSSDQAVERLIAHFLDRESAATRRAYEQALRDFAAYKKATSPTAAVRGLLEAEPAQAQSVLERYKRSLVGIRDAKNKLVRGRGLSAASVNLRLAALRGILKQGFKARLIVWDVDVRGIRSEIVKDVRGPGDDVLNRMLAIAKDRLGPEGARDYAILRLAGELGLRRSEILALDLDDIDLETCEIRVLGKGRREKETVSCTQRTADALARWIALRPSPKSGAPLFTNLIPGRIGRISGPAVYVIVRRLGAEALPKRSRKKVSPHRIRHTAITAAVRNARGLGLAREEVKKFSRHADLRMLDRYIDADSKAQALLAKSVGDRLT